MGNPLLSSFDTERMESFAPEEIEVFQPTPVASKPKGRPAAPSLIGASKLGSTQEAFGNLGNFRNQQEGQSRALSDMARESGDFSNIKNRDINKLQRDPTGQLKDYYTKEVDNNVVDYVGKNELPAYQETEDGTKLFLNTGSQESIMRVAGDDHKKGGHYEASGPVGSYSSVWVEDLSSLETLATNPYIAMGASFIPGGTAALTALKVATGQKVTATDLLMAGVDGLKVTGMLKPPQGAAAAKKAGETARSAAMTSGSAFGDAINAGKAAETAALVGKGVGGLNYGQTMGLMNAAASGASGNIGGALVGYYGPQLTAGALSKVGVDNAFLQSKGIQVDDFTAGLNKAISKVAQGGSAKDALMSGFVEYIKEGGTLGSYSLPDFDGNFPDFGVDFGKLEDAVRWAGSKIEDGTRAVGSLIDDNTWEKIKDTDLKGIEDGLRKVGSGFDDAVTRPTGKVLSAVDTAVRGAVNPLDNFVDDIDLKPVEDVFRAAVNPLDNWVDDLPKLPKIDLPNIDLPEIGGLLGGGGGGFNMPMPSGSRTTDKIFNNELFRFKGDIGLGEFEDILSPNQVSLEDLLTSPFESQFR
jgi:hypothetical protein